MTYSINGIDSTIERSSIYIFDVYSVCCSEVLFAWYHFPYIVGLIREPYIIDKDKEQKESRNEDNLKNEDDLKKEDTLKNEDDFKNEDNLKNKDDLKNETDQAVQQL